MEFVFISDTHGYIRKELIKSVVASKLEKNVTYVYTSKNDNMIVGEPLSVVMARIESSVKTPLVLSTEEIQSMIAGYKDDLVNHTETLSKIKYKEEPVFFNDVQKAVIRLRTRLDMMTTIFGYAFVGEY